MQGARSAARGPTLQGEHRGRACQAVPTWAPNAQFPDFALTFIGTSGVDDALYLMATKLGRFDVTSGAVTVVGSPLSPQASGDMTSAGDGTLYFLWDETTPTLYDIDPTNASVIDAAPRRQRRRRSGTGILGR